jgi:hypothetical protein
MQGLMLFSRARRLVDRKNPGNYRLVEAFEYCGLDPDKPKHWRVLVYRAFRRTKGIAGPLEVLAVPDVDVSLKRLSRGAQPVDISAGDF